MAFLDPVAHKLFSPHIDYRISYEKRIFQVSLNYIPILGGIKQCKSMVNSRDFPSNSTLIGLVR